MNTLDWNIYNEEIDKEIDSNKDELISCFFDDYKDYIGNRVYFFLEKMIPLIDFDKHFFTIRMSYDCVVDKQDERNIIFNLSQELETYDKGDLERLSKLKEIFKNSMNMVEAKIIELKRND